MGRRFCFGSKATEVWVPDQTSGAQAPFFGGLLGPAARSAAKAATPPQFALRARGHRAHVVLGSRPKQRPSLLGLSARSALTRDARAGCALRGRGQCPLPVCPSPASWQAQSDRALCSGVLRRGLGRVAGPVWTKNRSGRAVTCVSFPPSQRRAPFRGIHKGFPLMCAFYLAFCTSKKQAVRPDGTGHPLPLAAHLLK